MHSDIPPQHDTRLIVMPLFASTFLRKLIYGDKIEKRKVARVARN